MLKLTIVNNISNNKLLGATQWNSKFSLYFSVKQIEKTLQTYIQELEPKCRDCMVTSLSRLGIVNDCLNFPCCLCFNIDRK